MTRFLRFAGVWAVIAAAACIDKPMPTQLTTGARASVRLNTSIVATAATPPAAVIVRVDYLRTTGQLVALDSQRVGAAPGERLVELHIDLEPCLADPKHAGGAACSLRVSLDLVDAASAILDRVLLPPITAAKGQTSRVDGVVLTSTGTVVLPDTATLGVGDTVRLAPVVKDAGGAVLANHEILFSSSDTAVAVVSSDGLVRVRGIGLAVITASSGAKSGTIRIQVSPPVAGAVSAGDDLTCALDVVGKAWCWGLGTAGQLGNGALASSNAPVAVSGGLTFKHISAAMTHACGVERSGDIYCWGSNSNGQLGVGTGPSLSSVPVRVASGVKFQTVSASPALYTCALGVDQNAYCWGSNLQGRLAVGDTAVGIFTPQRVVGSVRFASVLTGLQSLCGLAVDGVAYCWGSNVTQATGTGQPSTDNLTTPTRVAGSVSFQSVTPGVTSCGLSTSGAGYCWGTDRFGVLGNNAPGNTVQPVPTAIVGGLTFRSLVATNSNFTFEKEACGITQAGTGYCWGSNARGGLGVTTTPSTCTGGAGGIPSNFGCSGTPIPINTSATFATISPGGGQVCGITRTHTLLCWGDNTFGQVGDGTTIDRFAPVTVNLRVP